MMIPYLTSGSFLRQFEKILLAIMMKLVMHITIFQLRMILFLTNLNSGLTLFSKSDIFSSLQLVFACDDLVHVLHYRCDNIYYNSGYRFENYFPV